MLNKRIFFTIFLVFVSIFFYACPYHPDLSHGILACIDLTSDEFSFNFSDEKTKFKISEDFDVKYRLKLDSYVNETSDVYIGLYKQNNDGEMEYQNNLSFIMESGDENKDCHFLVENKKETGIDKYLKFNLVETGIYELKFVLFSTGAVYNPMVSDLRGESILYFEVTE